MRLKRVPRVLEFRRISSKRTPKISFLSYANFSALFFLLLGTIEKKVVEIIYIYCIANESIENVSRKNDSIAFFEKYRLAADPAWRLAGYSTFDGDVYILSDLHKVTRSCNLKMSIG